MKGKTFINNHESLLAQIQYNWSEVEKSRNIKTHVCSQPPRKYVVNQVRLIIIFVLNPRRKYLQINTLFPPQEEREESLTSEIIWEHVFSREEESKEYWKNYKQTSLLLRTSREWWPSADNVG